MSRFLRFFSAAVIAAGTCGIFSNWSFAQEPTPQPQQQQPQERDGIGILPGVAPDHELTPVGPMQTNNIRGTLATATEAAMTRGQLRSVAQRLTTPDEARLHEFVRLDHPQLDQLIEQLDQAWQARYNQRFNISDRAAVYPAQIVRIELGVTEEALAVRERGANGIGRDARVEGQVDHGVTARAEVEVRPDAQPAAARDGVRQSNVVTVIFPASGEMPELHVPLVNEGTVTDTWRIDIPLHVDGQTVHDNLVSCMTKALEQQEQWPADVNEAYRKATHLVMRALLDVKDEHRDEARPDPRERMGQPEQIGEPAARPGDVDRPQQPE